jgi:hypothetical protein
LFQQFPVPHCLLETPQRHERDPDLIWCLASATLAIRQSWRCLGRLSRLLSWTSIKWRMVLAEPVGVDCRELGVGIKTNAP